MKLKICGIRNKEMIDFCQENQVDFCGFNFVPISKRKIKKNFKIPKNFVPQKVGIFQNQSFEEISKILNNFDLDILQFHGNENEVFLQKIKKTFPKFKIWKAFSIQNNFDLNKIKKISNIIDLVLFDGNVPGSGKKIDKNNQNLLLDSISFCEKQNIPYGIAGGINSKNIAEFRGKFSKATLLDIASGVEENKKFNISTAQKVVNNFRK